MKTDEIKEPPKITTPKMKQEESKVNEDSISIKENSGTLNNAEEVKNVEEENQMEIPNLEEEKKDESINEEDLKFKFKEKLLANEIHKVYGNRLREDYKYDNEGENGLFEANPRIVKISGFELNKRIMTKIDIINKSKYSERIIILPPTSPNFKIRYTKRGQIAPGLSETIYLFFTPSEYKYYTDNICINCPGNKIIIPIHAYPRMNIFVKEYIPKLIDFGNIPIDSTVSKNISVKNLIDQNFKYKITPMNDYPEIKIDKMEDTFYEMRDNLIKITISPKKYGIFKADYEFQVSEVDFQPYIFTVFATCNSFETSNVFFPRYLAPLKTKKKKEEENMMALQNEEKENNGEIKEEEKSNKINISKIENMNETMKSEKENLENNNIIKDTVLTEEERKESNRNIKTPNNSQIRKEKEEKKEEKKNEENIVEKKEENKLEESIASDITRPESKILSRFKDLPSSKEKEFLQYYNNNDDRIQAKEFKYIRFIGKEPLNEKETNDLLDERNTALKNIVDYNCKIDKGRHKPELDKEKCVIDRDQEYYLKPNFNSNQNDNFFKTRHYFKIFLKGITKVIIRKRAEQRIKKLNEMLNKHSIRNKESFANYCNQDWINFFSKDQQSVNDDKSFNFMQMKFIPPQKLLLREKVWLTNEYSLNSLKQNIPHENNINLEEYETLKDLERNDLQVINYNKFENPGLTQFNINLGEKVHKELFELSDKFMEHIYTEPKDLIFGNPLLKNYKSLNKFNECDIDYNLQPREIKECYLKNSSYQNDIYMKLNLSFTDNDKIRTRLIDNESMFMDNSVNFNFSEMKKLNQSDQKDLYIKKTEKVDEDNFIFELTKEDDKAIVDNIEKEDNEIKAIRDMNKEGTFDIRKQEKINLENKFSAIKKKWMSLVPTYIEYINSGIKNPSNKLLP